MSSGTGRGRDSQARERGGRRKSTGHSLPRAAVSASQAPQADPAQKLTPRGEQKRSQILDAAAAVLADRGFAGTTLAEIAERAGTQAGSLYYHFESREDLVEEVLHHGVAQTFAHVRACLAAMPADAGPRDRLATAVREHVRFQLVVSNYARASARSNGQVPAEMRNRINEEFRRYGAFLDGLFAAAVQAGAIDGSVDRKALRMLVIGAANWTPEWYRDGGSSSAEQIADLLVRLLFRGAGYPS
ncbi:TetR/AcrR family transcriptional regulator [Zavarzinia sp. CC-PAN008]|uniref:TetR/AcrR family transcriptional regulator n=1 Tax=Zavarzinia sp. CC-PAN008 TaxID=3243332 RepID=UPI003F742A70